MKASYLEQTDYLTKWVELRAIPSAKAEDVATVFVEQIIPPRNAEQNNHRPRKRFRRGLNTSGNEKIRN